MRTAPRTTRLARGRRAAALAGALLLAGSLTAGCAKASPDHDEFVKVLQQSGLPKAESECAADALFDSLSDDQIEKIMIAGASAVPRDDPARTDDPHDKVIKALAACRDAAPSTTTSTTTP